jgi:hypothetical protein
VPAEPTTIPTQLYSDFRWAVNNLEADGEDIVTSPCHAGELLKEPAFYWTTFAAAAALGGAFAFDTPVHTHTKHISHGAADTLESGGQIALWSATALVYGWGVWSDDSRSRRYMLTTVESTAIAGLLARGAKAAFGRLRPNADEGAFQFCQGGYSFVSDLPPRHSRWRLRWPRGAQPAGTSRCRRTAPRRPSASDGWARTRTGSPTSSARR